MTVIIVIDQFSAHYIPKLRPFLHGGIKLLADQGVNYTNAFYNHSMPGTGPGHTLLATGTYGTFHGIVNNRWFDYEGKTIECDDDSVKNAAVFAPKGVYDYGKSARNIAVDGLSDQLKLHSYPHARNIVWSLSLKSRAAIPMAGRLGNAIWFDEKSGNFTSSKAYFQELPQWVKEFNKHEGISTIKKFMWKPFFSRDNPAYKFKNVHNYKYSAIPFSIIGKELKIDPKKGFDEIYTKTPLANKNLVNLAIACIKKNYSGKKQDRFILWLSLSSLDKVSHAYGPNSKEAIDMVYHMDHHIKKLIEAVYAQVPKEDVLFVLTADHGVEPITEIVRDRGLDLARRYDYNTIVLEINKLIEKKYGIHAIVQNFKAPQFYLNQKLLSAKPLHIQQNILNDINQYLRSLPGIRRAWTFDELQKAIFAKYDLDKYLQRQLYRGRSGQIIFAVQPYTTIHKYLKGTSHVTEYAYDTQVPLIFYQAGKFTKKRIARNVFMPQVSVTLATLLNVPRPSATTANVLPGLKL